MRKKKSIIGLDIGSSSVKAVRIERGEGAFHLMRAALKEIPFSDDEKSRQEQIPTAVKDLLNDTDIRQCDVRVAVNSAASAVARVIVPHMPKDELARGIKLEARNYFPFPVDDAILDFEILGDVVEKGMKKYEVIVAVIPRNTAEQNLAILRQAGVEPVSLVATAYALYKAAGHLIPDEDTGTCVVDIGEIYTELIVCRGRRLLSSRKLPLAGSDFTKALTGALVSERGKVQLSRVEAEDIKRNIGFPAGGQDKIIGGKISTGQIIALLGMPLEQLVNEIERSCAYYAQENAGGAKINSLVLLGGAAALGGCVRYLSESLNVPARIGNPFEGLKMRSDLMDEAGGMPHRFAPAVGAALGGADCINLLPSEMKSHAAGTVKRGACAMMIGAAFFISLLLYAGLKIKLSHFSKRIAAAHAKLETLQGALKKSGVRALASRVLADEPYWDDVFTELSNVSSDALFLEEIKMGEDGVLIKGVIVSARADELLSEYILTLEKGMFDDVRLITSDRTADKENVVFELRCRTGYENTQS